MNSEVIIALLVALLLTVAFGGIGGALLRWAGLAREGTEAFRLLPVATALGFAAFSFLGYPLALLAPVPAWAIVALAAAGAAMGVRYYRQIVERARAALWPEARALRSPGNLLLALLTLAMAALLLTNGLAPVKEGDALQGYMFTARWLAHQGLTYNPYNSLFTFFPLNTELVYALSYPFGTDLAAKALDVLLGLVFLAGVFEFACRFVARPYAFLATVSIGLMQEFANNWGAGKLDVLVSFTFFSGLSLLFPDNSERPDRPEKEESRFKPLALAAFLVGTACTQKYSIWILALPLAVTLGWLWPRRKLAQALFLFSTIIGLCLVPHLIKNFAWTNNPVAPLAQNLFPSRNIFLAPMSDATPMTWRETLLFPGKVFLEGFGKYGAGRLPLLILIGLPLLWLARAKSRCLTLVWVTGAMQLSLWILIRGQDWLVPRFIIVPVILLAVAGACGLALSLRNQRAGRGLAMAASCLLLVGPGLWTHRHWRASLPFVLGRESRAAWQQRVAPARGYVALQRLASELSADRRLFLGSELYNLPEEKVPFVCTEKEQLEFLQLPDARKLAYLKARGFGFYHHTEEREMDWTQELPLFAEYIPNQPGSLCFRIYRIEPPEPGVKAVR